jgi:outer membrane protein assembly factor BamB/pimeloyl-ACP methyl ester carboxylesterase
MKGKFTCVTLLLERGPRRRGLNGGSGDSLLHRSEFAALQASVDHHFIRNLNTPNWTYTMKRIILSATAVTLSLWLGWAQPTQAVPSFQSSATVGNGTPASCSEAALDAALQSASAITFNCGAANHTITLSTMKVIVGQVALDGGGRITLDGNHAHTLLRVENSTSLSIVNLTLQNGWAGGGSGGAIANLGALTVTNAIFLNNTADSFGGALLNYGVLRVRDSIFSENHAAINGGAIDSIGVVEIERSAFFSNTASFRGGAINNYQGELHVRESRFEHNRSEGYGGALVNDAGTASIAATLFVYNSAQDIGGAIRNNGDMELIDSTLAYNIANNGGGGVDNRGGLFVENSTFSANRSDQNGGGLNHQGGGAVSLGHVTMIGNVATSAFGGSLHGDGVIEIAHSVVLNSQNSALNCSGSITSLGYNLESSDDCDFNALGDQQGQQPAMTPLQDNGGPTLTHAPLAANLIDQVPLGQCPPTDQRGLARPQGLACDIGAIEVYVAPPHLSPIHTMPWPMLGRETGRAGRSRNAGPDDAVVLTAPWPYLAGGRVSTAPVVDLTGSYYFGAQDGRLYAVDRLGATRFTFDAGAPIRSSPALVADGPGPTPGEPSTPPLTGAVYFGADDGNLFAVSSIDGGLRWSLAPGNPPNSAPLRSAPAAVRLSGSNHSRVYVGSESGKVYAVFETSANSAVTAWEVTTGVPATSAPALSPDASIVYVGGADGKLYCLDASTGSHLAQTPVDLGQGALTTPVVDEAGNVYVGSQAGVVTSFDKECRRRPYWHPNLHGPIHSAPALGKDGEVLALANNTLYGISRYGDLRWSQAFPRPVGSLAPIVDSAGATYVGSSDGWLYAVTHPAGAGSGVIKWTLAVAPPGASYLGAPALDGFGRLVLGAGDNLLQVIDDLPAYQLLYHGQEASPGNLDIYSLREEYGVVQAARSERLSEHPSADRQPAYSLDAGLTAFVTERVGTVDVLLADGVVGQEQFLIDPASGAPYSATSPEVEPAFSPVDDLNGRARLPDGKPYVALTSLAGTVNRLVFVDLAAYARGLTSVQNFSNWANLQGVPAVVQQDLELPATGQSQPAFAPDGRKFAWRHCDPERALGYVRLLILNGSQSHIMQVGGPIPIEGGRPCEDFAPTFSPDSRWLAMQESGQLAIYSVEDPTTPLFRRPVPSASPPLHPTWSPDGSEITLMAAVSGNASLWAMSGAGYSQAVQLAGGHGEDEPAYAYHKMPPPQLKSVSPDHQTPGETIQLFGRGFDILHPLDNLVYFTDTLHSTWLRADVIGAHVDPNQGLGVLTVRVPVLAGHGPLKVQTRFGVSICCQFFVVPKPVSILQPASVPGAKVRIFGVGFDLKPASQNRILFAAAAGGWVSATVISASVSGLQEMVIVEVPPGVAETAPIRAVNGYGGADCACSFTLLHPTIALLRTGSQLPVGQVCSGFPFMLEGKEFPFDPFFGYGSAQSALRVETQSESGVVVIGVQPFAPTTPQSITVGFRTQTLHFPPLGLNHPGGAGTVWALDVNLPAARATAAVRTPRRNLPVIFVPGITASALDAVTLFPYTAPPDINLFPEPGFASTELHTYFPTERIWLGYIGIGEAALRRSRYFDALRLKPDGITPETDLLGLSPNITVTSILWSAGPKGIHEELRKFLQQRGLAEGTSLFYFPYDWRKDLTPTAARLDALIDQARAASGQDKVVLISHSMGGMIARNYLLRYGATKVDQFISIGTPYLGAPKAAKVLEVGDNWGLILLPDNPFFGLHPLQFKKLARNFAAAYQLAPAADYFAPGLFDGNYDPRYLVTTTVVNNITTQIPLDAAQSRALLGDRHNRALVEAAVMFHSQGIGDLSRVSDQLFAQRIIGQAMPTIGHVVYGTGQICYTAPVVGLVCFPYPQLVFPLLDVMGDGTVPIHSGMGANLFAGDDRFYFVTGIEHAELTEDKAQVQTLLTRMLDGALCSNQQAGVVSTPSQENRRQATAASADAGSGALDQGVEVMALGNVEMQLRDGEGRRTGRALSTPYGVEREIPGATFELTPQLQMAMITVDGTYHITLTGVLQGGALLRVRWYDNGEVTQTEVFPGMAISTTTVATLTLNTVDGTISPLHYRYDAKSPPQTLTAGTLQGDSSADLSPPTTSIHIDNGVISLQADDGPAGSGVREILYRVEPGAEGYRVYGAPFAAPAGATGIRAVATDRAGNSEYPGAHRQIDAAPQQRIFLPVVVR